MKQKDTMGIAAGQEKRRQDIPHFLGDFRYLIRLRRITIIIMPLLSTTKEKNIFLNQIPPYPPLLKGGISIDLYFLSPPLKKGDSGGFNNPNSLSEAGLRPRQRRGSGQACRRESSPIF